jgi:hypothetical protein
MLNVTLKQAKVKFSEKPILSAKDKGTRKALKSIGALVRTVARRSMKKKKTASQPGQPPRVIEGKLKRFLFFVVDNAESVTIGPAKLAETGTPSILEYGGVKKNRVRRNGRRAIQQAKVEARPYMGPAYLATENKYADLFKNAFK